MDILEKVATDLDLIETMYECGQIDDETVVEIVGEMRNEVESQQFGVVIEMATDTDHNGNPFEIWLVRYSGQIFDEQETTHPDNENSQEVEDLVFRRAVSQENLVFCSSGNAEVSVPCSSDSTEDLVIGFPGKIKDIIYHPCKSHTQLVYCSDESNEDVLLSESEIIGKLVYCSDDSNKDVVFCSASPTGSAIYSTSCSSCSKEDLVTGLPEEIKDIVYHPCKSYTQLVYCSDESDEDVWLSEYEIIDSPTRSARYSMSCSSCSTEDFVAELPEGIEDIVYHPFETFTQLVYCSDDSDEDAELSKSETNADIAGSSKYFPITEHLNCCPGSFLHEVGLRQAASNEEDIENNPTGSARYSISCSPCSTEDLAAGLSEEIKEIIYHPCKAHTQLVYFSDDSDEDAAVSKSEINGKLVYYSDNSDEDVVFRSADTAGSSKYCPTGTIKHLNYCSDSFIHEIVLRQAVSDEEIANSLTGSAKDSMSCSSCSTEDLVTGLPEPIEDIVYHPYKTFTQLVYCSDDSDEDAELSKSEIIGKLVYCSDDSEEDFVLHSPESDKNFLYRPTGTNGQLMECCLDDSVEDLVFRQPEM